MFESRSSFSYRILDPLYEVVRTQPVVCENVSCKNVRLGGYEVNPIDVFDFGFGELTGLEFAHLFSAFDGSRMQHVLTQFVSADGAPPGRYFVVVNPRLIQGKNKSGIFQDASSSSFGPKSLYLEHFFLLNSAPVRLGTYSLFMSAVVAHSVGLQKIELLAAGGRGASAKMIGYKVWPKLGFDCLLNAEDKALFPAHLKECQTICNLIDIDSAWWDANGTPRHMTFDLSPNSASWNRLLAYITRSLYDARRSTK